MRSRRLLRGTAGWVVLCLGVTASIASGAEPQRGFVDGSWTGSFSWRTSVTEPLATGEAVAGGRFEAVASGGQMTGDFEMVGRAGSVTTEDSSASIEWVVVGNVGGTAEFPLLNGTLGKFIGTASAQGIEVPIDITMGAGEMPPFDLSIRTASCDVVAGDFKVEEAQIQAMVSSFQIVEGRWSATRTGSAGLNEAQEAELGYLLDEAVTIESQVAAGTFDHAAITDLLARAAVFATALERNEECGLGSPSSFSTVISGVVASIVDIMVENSDVFSAEDFRSLVVSALAAGVIGPGSGQEGSDRTQALVDVLGDLLVAAENAGDRDALISVAVAADALGSDALAKDAYESAAFLEEEDP